MARSSEIPKTMHANRKHKGNPEAVWEEIPVPQTPPNGFLVKILAAGVCHSDVPLVELDSRAPNAQDKFTLGHEGCGTIADVGSDVGSEYSHFKRGDRVAINPVAGCGKQDCPECSNGLPQLCEKGDRNGLGQDGSFTEYIAISARSAIPVPDGVSSAAAAVSTDAVMTSHHAIVRRGQIKESDTVFVFGLGGLGFNALQVLLHIGCKLFVSEQRQGPIEEAIKLGLPEEDVVPAGKDLKEWVSEKGLTGKIDKVVDFVGVQQTWDDAAVIVRRGGTIISVGLIERSLKTDHILCITKAITILYTFGGHSEDVKEGMELITQGVLTPRVETAPLKEFPKVLKELHEGRVKSRMVLIPEDVQDQ